MERMFYGCFWKIALLLFTGFSLQLQAQNLPDPERFESAILQFEALDRINPPPKDAIVLTGSSSIARWNEQSHAALAPLTVIPRGFGGSIMNDVLHYLDRVALTYEPRAILIYEGDNDIVQGVPVPVVLATYKKVITRILDDFSETRIYLISVKPSIARESLWSDMTLVNRVCAPSPNKKIRVLHRRCDTDVKR